MRTLGKSLSFFYLLVAVTAPAIGQVALSDQSYDIIPGYFDGDSNLDILAVAKDQSNSHLFYKGDGTGQFQLADQSFWKDGLFGIPWDNNGQKLIPGYFNQDYLSDFFYQGGSSTRNSGAVTSAFDVQLKLSFARQWLNGQLGLDWDVGSRNIIAGNFVFKSGLGTDLLLQNRLTADNHALITSMTEPLDNLFSTFGDTGTNWTTNFPGLTWNAEYSAIYSGDFNGDGYTDVFIQAKRDLVVVSSGGGYTVTANPQPVNAILLNDQYGHFTVYQTWPSDYLGQDWFAEDATPIIGDFNGDGRDDILLQAHNSTTTSAVLQNDTSGKFTSVAQSFTDGVNGLNWSLQNVTIKVVPKYMQQLGKNPLLIVGHDGTIKQVTLASNSTGLVENVETESFNGNPFPVGGVDHMTGTTVFGKVAGSFSVTPNGSASYSIPIAVPPGLGGMQPKLALNYSSGSGDSTIGVGWSLSGLSAISRCPKSYAQDGDVSGISLNSTDRLCLDGQRLVLIAGLYGTNGARYRTENDTFSIIIEHADINNAGAWFEVKTKAGQTLQFGATDDSRFNIQTSPPISWSVNKITDAANNYLTVQYREDTSQGSQYPDTIHYSMNGGYDTHKWVKFVYEDRPDVQTGYIKAYAYTHNLRLAEINTFYNPDASIDTQFIQNYQIIYQTSEVNGQSLVASIRQCAGDGSCKPATNFNWQASTLDTYTWSTTPIDTGICSDTTCDTTLGYYAKVQYPDLNGDGLADICTFDKTKLGIYCAITNHDGTHGALTKWYGPICFYNPLFGNKCYNPTHYQFVDMNGDGKADLVYHNNYVASAGIQIAYSNGSTAFGNLNTTGIMSNASFPQPSYDADNNCLANCQYWNNYSDETYHFFTVDINSDGLTDLCGYEQTGFICHFNKDGRAFVGSKMMLSECQWGMGTQISCRPDQTFFADIDQDGKADIVYRTQTGIKIQFSSGANASTNICADGSTLYGVCNDGDNYSTIQLTDVTGDGIVDLCFRSDNGVNCIPGTVNGFATNKTISTSLCKNWITFKDNTYACRDNSSYSVRFVDLNADGKADLIFRTSAGMRSWLSTGTGFVPYLHSIWNRDILSDAYTTQSDYNNVSTDNFADFNGDGVPDFSYRSDGNGIKIYLSQTPPPNRIDQITDGFGNQTNITYAPLTDPAVYTQGTSCSYPVACATGPAYVVKQYSADNGIGGTGKYAYAYQDLRTHMLGRGFLGFAQFSTYDYQSHIRTVITTDQTGSGTITNASTGMNFLNVAVYPSLGMPTQKTTTFDDGTTSKILDTTSYQNAYFYTEGTAYFPYFASSTTDKYDFDTGQNLSTETTTNSFDVTTDPGSHLAGDITDMSVTTVDHANNQTFSKITHSTYENDFTPTVWHIGRVTNTKVIHSGYGDTQVRESGFHYYPATTLAVDPQGDSYWQFAGMLAYTEEEPTALNGTDDIKPEYLKTSYYYDQFGEKQKVEVEGYTGIPLTLQSRYSKSVYGLSTLGQRIQTVDTYNQLGHHESREVDSAYGVTVSQTGPNSLTTSWNYDGFGRVLQENRADGTQTTTSRGFCKGQCPVVGSVTPTYWTTVQASGGAPVTNYYDQLGRELRASTTDVSGRSVYQDSVYDANGRVQQRSQRYFAGEIPLWSHVYYDAIGRILREEAPSGTTTANSYSALTTTTTVTRRSNLNPTDAILAGESDYEARVTVTAYHADGKVHRITDPASGQTEFFYDAVGNLIETDAPKQAPGDHSTGDYIKTVMHYDRKGRKTSMVDPDMGTWSYSYDSFGKLLKQVDAKGQTVVMVYDKLDRMVLRIEPEGISRWVYDNNLTGNASGAHIGKLMFMAGPIPLSGAQYNAYIVTPPDPASITLNGSEPYSRSYIYDNLGRPVSVSTTMDGGTNPQTFQVDRNYDAYSRVHQVIYPTNVANTRFTLEYRYDVATGTLLDVHDPVSGKVYWALGTNGNTADALSANGQVQQETYGNGIVTDRYYDRTTGLVQAIYTSNTTVQGDEYVFDSLGNLQKRQDGTHYVNNTPYNEVFHYDTLNRVSHVWLNGTNSQAFSYTASGNIDSKSTWYPAAPTVEAKEYYHYDGSSQGGPHAVAYTSSDAAGTDVLNTYQYDANGNLYSGAGRGMSYTSFNLPWNIARGSALDTFYYAADHTRYKQVDLSKTVYYLRPEANVGAHFERQMENGVTTDIHYIYAGGGLVATHHVRRNSDGSTNSFDQYYHRDHLGSPEVITDGNGVVVERLSYTAFGERRPADWTTPNATTLIAASFTHYGFTGHEHMDDVGLIHMNGRVYDPKLGRFLSADPNIQAPQNSQSFNRYSYVMNNPLSLTDPSGLFSLGSMLGDTLQFWGNALDRFISDVIFPQIPTAIAVVGAYVTGVGFNSYAVGGAMGGGINAAAGGGNIVLGALVGAFSASLYLDIGDAIANSGLNNFEAMMAHGIVGGLSSGLQGGRVESGFVAAFAGKGMSIYGGDIPGPGALKAAIAGGITSELGGGKFGNGAFTAAMGYLFNDAAEHKMKLHEKIHLKVKIGEFLRTKIEYELNSDEGLKAELEGELKAGQVKVLMNHKGEGKISFGHYNIGFKGTELDSYGVSVGALTLTLSDAGGGYLNWEGKVNVTKYGDFALGGTVNLIGRVQDFGNATYIHNEVNRSVDQICSLTGNCIDKDTMFWPKK